MKPRSCFKQNKSKREFRWDKETKIVCTCRGDGFSHGCGNICPKAERYIIEKSVNKNWKRRLLSNSNRYIQIDERETKAT
jgi:hypothetical protein